MTWEHVPDPANGPGAAKPAAYVNVRLYAAGALTSYVVPSEEGPHRKYYGITPAGRAQLETQTKDWGTFTETVTALLTTGGRP